MNLLDRHIFKSSFFVCAATMGLFAFLLMIGNAIRDLVGLLLAGQIAYGEAGRLVLLLIPFVISYALPMGVLTGILLTVGRLSADNEITAMRAAGISLVRFARPLLLLGVIGAIIGVRIDFESMPWARVEYEKEFTAAVRNNPLNFIVPRTFIRDFPGFVVYVGEKHGGGFNDCWIWEMDAGRRVTRLIRAGSGVFGYDSASDDLIVTLFRAAVETRTEGAPENFSAAQPVGTFDKWEELRLPLSKLLNRGGVRQKLPWMNYAELRARQAALARAPVPPGGRKEQAVLAMDVALAIAQKFNSAFAVFTFAFVGIPLGIRVSRRETTANLGVAVVIALSYYFVTAAISWLDHQPQWRPDLLLWLPNLAIVAIGCWLFRRLERQGR